MKRVYEAFDGKIFKDDKECLAYEQNLKEENVVKNVKFYDSNNNLINIEKIYDINYILYNIYKVVIPTEEDCNTLNEWLENYCIHTKEIHFPGKGTWYSVPITTITIVSADEMEK